MGKTPKSLQDQLLNHLRQHKIPTTIFLNSGTKLQGIVTDFDAFSLILHRENTSQLVYKHAISTIIPNRPVHFASGHIDDEPETNPV